MKQFKGLIHCLSWIGGEIQWPESSRLGGSSGNDSLVTFCYSLCRDVSELTGFPEMLGGRVKTLHPAVHAGKGLTPSLYNRVIVVSSFKSVSSKSSVYFSCWVILSPLSYLSYLRNPL